MSDVMQGMSVRCGARSGEVLKGGEGVVTVFDGPVYGGVSIVFGPDYPADSSSQKGLWWTMPVTPEVIDEVLRVIQRQGLPVEAIVIRGLERYPIFLDGWPRWIARWSCGGAVGRIVIDTTGLADDERHRLVAATRRRLAMTRPRDPVTKAVGKFKRWFDGRFR